MAQTHVAFYIIPSIIRPTMSDQVSHMLKLRLTDSRSLIKVVNTSYATHFYLILLGNSSTHYIQNQIIVVNHIMRSFAKCKLIFDVFNWFYCSGFYPIPIINSLNSTHTTLLQTSKDFFCSALMLVEICQGVVRIEASPSIQEL